MCDEVIRISSGKPLELDINMLVGLRGRGHRCGEDELYMHIRERTTSLSDHPNICTHFWNPGTHRSITRLQSAVDVGSSASCSIHSFSFQDYFIFERSAMAGVTAITRRNYDIVS